MARHTLNNPRLSISGHLTPADLVRLEALADVCQQAAEDVEQNTRQAGLMLDQLAHDLANDRAAVRLWAEVEALQ